MCELDAWERLQQWLQQGAACVVEVLGTQGSAPRNAGAWMALRDQQWIGTIGGGHLEWLAMQQAAQWWGSSQPGQSHTVQMALGPSLGQCCGGAVQLRWSHVLASDLPVLQQRLHTPRMPVALFGAGHVGQALVRTLQALPMQLHWFDSRDSIPSSVGQQGALTYEHSNPVHDAVADLPAGTAVLIMSFSHVEDLELTAACLRRQRVQGDLPFVGLIGSATKWAVFQRRLLERGFTPQELAHITTPIGVPGIAGKEPEVIAVSVAAQLLQQHARWLAAI